MIVLCWTCAAPIKPHSKSREIHCKKYWTRSWWWWCHRWCGQAAWISGLWMWLACNTVLLKSEVGVKRLSHCCNHWSYGINFVSCCWSGSSRPPGIDIICINSFVNIFEQNITTCHFVQYTTFLAWFIAYHGNYKTHVCTSYLHPLLISVCIS